MTYRIFWDDKAPSNVPLQGGLMFRAFGLQAFIDDCEKKGLKIHGIKLEAGSNNMELIYSGELKKQ